MENTKRWSKVFIWIGRISITILLLVIFRLKLGFEYPSEEQYYLTLINIKYKLLIIAPFSLLIGYAIKCIYTEILRMFRDTDYKIQHK